MDRVGPRSGLLGRDAESQAVDRFLVAAERGAPVLVLQGEPGIGKTTLWWEAVRRAGDRGTRVLATRATESEASLSLAGLADLLDVVDEALLDQLAEPQQQAVAAALLRGRMPRNGINQRALCAAVLSILRLLAARGPVIVAVDDAHWLDSASATVLGFGFRRLVAEPVGLLVAVRTVGQPLPSFDTVVEPDRRTVVRLGPLTVAGLHELIKERTGLALPRPTVVQVARVCGGNPLYALEIAAALGGRSPQAGQLPVPPSLGQLIAARVQRLPAATREALLVASALSQPVVDLVGAARLEPAERAGIATVEATGRIQFTHPLFASAVYGAADPATRRRVHRRLAGQVGDPEERARHAALGATGPDPAIASQLDAAAVLAGSRGAPAVAGELVEMALRLTPQQPSTKRSERLLAAARFWAESGDLARSVELLDRAVLETPAGPLRARVWQQLGQLYGRRSSLTQAVEAARRALTECGDDRGLRVGIQLDVAFCCAGLGEFLAAEQHAHAAIESAGDEEPGALAEALAVTTMTGFLCGRGFDEARLARALELEDPNWDVPMQMRPSYIRAHLLMWNGRLQEARAALDDIRRQALERGEEYSIPILCLYLVWTCVWQGDLTAATGFAEEAARTAALLGDPGAQGSALTASALVHAYTGDVALVRTEAQEAIDYFQRLHWPAFSLWALWPLGLAELSDGRPEAVHAALHPITTQIRAMGDLDPVVGVFVPDEVEALIELGDLDGADRLFGWLADRAAAVARPWPTAVTERCRGSLCTARGDFVGAWVAFDLALAAHDRAGMPFERARTLLALGRAQRRAGRRAAARMSLQEALAAFGRLGARRWAERCAAELDRSGGGTARPDQLTPTERRVAELAAAGLANDAIAARAALSIKTVEANLTRVYRKLGIRSRATLAGALQRSPD